MIEVSHLASVEAHESSFCSIHAHTDLAILDALYGAEVAVGNLHVPLRSRELDFVSDSKFTLDLSVCCDAPQPGRGIRYFLSVLFPHGDEVFSRVRGNDLCIASGLDAM